MTNTRTRTAIVTGAPRGIGSEVAERKIYVWYTFNNQLQRTGCE
jgi:hypothetical protein